MVYIIIESIVKKIQQIALIFCQEEPFIDKEMREITHDPSRIPTIEGKLKSDQLIPAEKLSNKAPRF